MYNEKSLQNLTPWKKISWHTADKANGGSTVIRVPARLAEEILRIAHQLDLEAVKGQMTQLVNDEGQIAGIELLKPEGSDTDPNFDEEAWNREVQPEIDEFEIEFQALNNGTYKDQSLVAGVELTEEIAKEIYQDIKAVGEWSIEYYAEMMATSDVRKIFDIEDDRANTRREKLCPEIDAYRLERFAFHLQIADVVWKAYEPDDTLTEPNYHRIGVEPKRCERAIDWMIEKTKNDWSQPNITRRKAEFVYEEIKREATNFCKSQGLEVIENRMILIDGNWRVQEGKNQCGELALAERFFSGLDSPWIGDLGSGESDHRSWYYSQQKRFIRAINNVVEELNRVSANSAKMRHLPGSATKKQRKKQRQLNKLAEMGGKR